MMKRAICAVCCLWVLTLATASKTPVTDELRKKGYTTFLALADAAGFKEPAPNAMLTIFAPTNEALDKFIKEMKLTLNDMKSRPGLSAAVIAYHVLPRVKGKAADVQGATEAKPLEAITADGQHFLNFFMNPKEPDRVLVKDVQGNTGKVLKDSGSEVGNVAIYGIDTVMLSGDVFYTLADLLSRHPEFQPLREVYTKAGLDEEVKTMEGAANSLTVWAPTAKALQAAQPQLSALSKSDLQDVLRYHIVPQALVIPAGLEPGKAYPTAFKGHNLKFKFNNVPSAVVKSTGAPRSQQQEDQARKTVEVIPEAGTFGAAPSSSAAATVGPQVTLANLFANRMVIHGIDRVLKPNLPGKSAATTTEAAAKKSTDSKAAAPASPASSPQRSGRKLLQFRVGSGPSSVSTGLTTTQSSIRAAVEGRVGVDEATAFGRSAARNSAARCWNCLVDDQVVG